MSGLPELVEDWLAGTLSASERRQLAEVCRSQPGLATELARQRATHLALAHQAPTAASVLATVRTMLAAEHTGRRQRTVAQIRARIGARPSRRRATRPRRALVMLVGGGAILLLAVAGVFLVQRSSDSGAEAEVERSGVYEVTAGDGAFRTRDGVRSALRPGSTLIVGDMIEVGIGAAALELRSVTGVELALAPTSRLRVAEGLPSTLLHGEARVVVPSGQPFAIRTPHALAEVGGTRFVLQVDAASSHLAVREGMVRFAGEAVPAGRRARVSGGLSTPVLDPEPGLAVHWSFDDPERPGLDRSGHGRHLVLAGPTTTAGIQGLALHFDGIDDVARLIDEHGVDCSDGFALAVWIRLGQRDHSWPVSAKTGGWDGDRGFAVECNYHWLAFIGRGRESLRYQPLEWDAQWHHVAVTWSPAGAVLYWDGERAPIHRAGYRKNPTTAIGVLDELTLGRIEGQAFDDGRQLHFGGALDDFRLYTRALSPERIRALATAPGANDP